MNTLFGFEVEDATQEIEKPARKVYSWSNGKESGMFQAWFATMYFDFIGKSDYNKQTIDIMDYCGRRMYFSGTMQKYEHTL